MENTAVLERHSEAGVYQAEPTPEPDDAPKSEVPEFNEEEWDRQFGAVGGPSPSTTNAESTTLSQALGLPESLEDLWPGHVYIPPRILALEKMLSLANAAEANWNAGDLMEAANNAAAMVQPVVRRVDGDDLIELTTDEIKNEFDVLELIKVCHHILRDQGLVVEGVSGNAPSGRLIGVKNFLSSAAIMELTTSQDAETSPSPNSDS